MGVMDIGSTALRAAYTSLQTTSHNIANASTPGYSRQEVIVTSAGSTSNGGAGFLGGGVEVVGIERRYDEHLTREVNESTSVLAANEARSSELARLERLFSDAETGIAATYDAFGVSVADMVNQPYDQSARTVALHRARTLASTISSADNKIDQMRVDADLRSNSLIRDLNSNLQVLADINTRLAAAAGSTYTPNDLLDQRDALVQSVNSTLKADAHINGDGTVSLFAATGDALVLGDKASKLALVGDANDPERMRLSLLTEGNSLPLNDSMLGAGALQGLLEFRNDDVLAVRSRLGQMAAGLAAAYNDQQSFGIDAQGNQGVDLFNVGSARVVNGQDNTGSAQFSVTVDDGSALQPSDYTLLRDAGQYTLTRINDGQQTTLAGIPTTIDGLTISLDSGAVADGDRFSIKSGSAFAGEFSVNMQAPEQWANALPALPVLGENNAGSLVVQDFAVTSVDASVAETVTLTFTGPSTVNISGTGTGNPSGVVYTGDGTISFNGWEMKLAGVPQAGDTVVVSPPSDVDADNRGARGLLGLSEQNIIGNRPPSEAFGSLVGDLGTRSQTAAQGVLQAKAWQEGAQSARDEISGVNLDEEAARLLQFQQAYQAAAKVIATAQTMFDSLLTIAR